MTTQPTTRICGRPLRTGCPELIRDVAPAFAAGAISLAHEAPNWTASRQSSGAALSALL
mgnify:CR=1 FL=1